MEQKDTKKRKIIFRLIPAAVFISILAGIHIINGFTHISTDDAYISGRIHSIAPKITGTVIKVYIDDNQSVKKGDVLVEINPEDYELKEKEAQAALDAEKSRLADAEAGIKSAAASLEIREVELKQALLDKARAQALFKEGAITKERQEKITTAYNLSAAQVKAAREQLEKAKSLKELQGSAIKQREASLKIAQLNLSYTRICAPSDGYVTNKSVEEGNQVQPSQPLMAVVALDDIWVMANYKETQLKNVRPGQPARIRVDTYPGTIFSGKVDSIMAGTGAVFSLFPPENALGNYVKVVQRIPVKIVFDKETDRQHMLRIGMSCVPTINTKK